ncbi:DUF5916 domain-containing protein, partial [candidate division KSB1 bacterium]
VYIEKQNNKWKIRIGGIQTAEEAQSTKNKLNILGIKNPSIIKIIENPENFASQPSLASSDYVLPTDSENELHITEINSDVKIDGKLSEPEWTSSPSSFSGYFYQNDPYDREPSTEQTEVKILTDNKNLYFGIRCYQNDPDKIFATVMRRDGKLQSNDCIELFLDTYNDGRNSFYFSTNPLGAMVDAVVTDEGNFINRNWDAVWYCKTSRDTKGWCAEICIPFKSLQFKEGESYDWGINIGREIVHNNEASYIVPIPRALGPRGKYKPSLYAKLKNVMNPKNGKNIQVIPYVSGGQLFEYNPNENTSRFNRGLDIRYSITPNLVTDFTYNTDFAQVEADQEVVNFSRFNIRLPEKREFFLQSAGLFSFGGQRSQGGGDDGGDGGMRRGPSYMLYNTRAIGIHSGNEVPILGGAQLSGKMGKFSLGFLNIQTEKVQFGDTLTVPTTNYTALRLKRDVLKNSNIGLMFLNKQNPDGYYDRAIGIDSYFSFNNQYTINGSIANNIKPDVKNKNWAGTFGAAFDKDWVDGSISYTQLDTLFNPDMGFIRRENIRTSSGRLGFTKWLNNRYFKSISLRSDINYTTDSHNVLASKKTGGNLWLRFASGEFITIGVDRDYDFIPGDDQEIRGIQLDPGVYNVTSQSASFRTFSGRPVSASITYRWGEEYDGKGNSILLRNSLRISNNFNVSLSYSFNSLKLKNGEAKSNLASGRFSYSFNPQLFAKYYVQWNDADKKIVGNFLLDYIFKPKSHFYLVYNENRNTDLPVFKSIRDRALLVKFAYYWDL